MPIGLDQADDDGDEADDADRDADAGQRRIRSRVQPLSLAPRRVADRAVALVELPHDAVGALNDPVELLVSSFALNGRERRGGAFQLGLVHAFGAGDIALRLLDLVAESVSTVCFMLASAWSLNWSIWSIVS